MITKEQVEEKCTELECDIFMDGPCFGSDEIHDKLGEMFISAINNKYGINLICDDDWYENMWDCVYQNDIDSDEVLELGFEVYANWVNEYGLEKEFNEED